MSKYSLEGIHVSPEDFLHAFFDVKEKVCLRVFSDKPDSAFPGQKLEVEFEHFEDIEDSLKAHNEQGRSVYFVINYGGHEDSEIKRINAQFMECDNIPLEEQLAKIEAFPLEPSLIVKTRKSLHCYWLIKSPERKKFRLIQKKLIAYFGGDPAYVNESRGFRLLGFFHCKEKPILVECVKFNPEPRYTQKELESVLPEIPDEEEPQRTGLTRRKERGIQKGLAITGRKCLFIQHCKKNAKTLSEPDWYAMISNLALFEGGENAIHKLSKPYPKYDQKVTQAKIDHFHKSGTKPMTCRKIAEKGFVCPRLDSCGCKAPAGFAYRPLDIAEIRKLLNACKKAGNAVDNLQLAHRFVNDFLYNAESTFAEPFIKYEIREYFGLKSDDIKPLLKQYGDIYKEFTASAEARREKAGDELPEWYEHTKSGGLRFMPGILANHLAEHFDAFYTAEQYYFYGGGVYSPQGDKDAKAEVRTYLNPRDATLNQINDAEGQWQLTIRKAIREINPNPFIINTANGLYNTISDTINPHSPRYYSTVQMKANYDPEAQYPHFMEFLQSVLDEPEITLLQEMFGYFLVPITKAQKSFLLVGLPNVGKSTILTVLQEYLLRSENVSNIAWQRLSDRFTPAELFGKLANIFADLSSKSIEDAEIFKAVTGEDHITGERKNKDPFSFKPYARFLYSCNNIPRNLGDKSEGFYRRLIIIRFSKPVPEEKRDLNLKDKLRAEGDGILFWAIQGLKRLIANSYKFSETDRTRAELTRYKTENNSALAFVYEACMLEEGAECFKQDVYDAYKSYCDENNLIAMSNKRFNQELDAMEVVSDGHEAVSRRYVWRGIRLV